MNSRRKEIHYNVIMIIPLALLAEADQVGDAQDSMDNSVDELFDRALVPRALHLVDLDNMTLAKPGHLAIRASKLCPPSVLPSGRTFPTLHALVAEHFRPTPNVRAHGAEGFQQLLRATAKALASNPSAGVGRVPSLPRDYGDVNIQCKSALKAALEDGKMLMEVEFPPGGLLSIAGDMEGGDEMDLSAYYMRKIIRGFADAKSRVLFPDVKDEMRMTGTSQPKPFSLPFFSFFGRWESVVSGAHWC